MTEQVEEYEGCGSLPRQQIYPRRGRMQSKLQRIKVERIAAYDDNLAIEHAAAWQCRTQWLQQLRKVSVQRLFGAALDENLVSVTKDQRAKTVPLRFEDPIVARWQFFHALGQHRQERRIHRKIHDSMV